MATSKERKKGTKSLGQKSRQRKALFLPMDKSAVSEISLQFRLAFETIRQGHGDRASANCMAQVVLLTGFLTEAGHGALEKTFLDSIERQISALLNHGRESGEWVFPVALVEELTIVVNEHDRQLRETRLQAIVEASQRMDRLIRNSAADHRIVGREP